MQAQCDCGTQAQDHPRAREADTAAIAPMSWLEHAVDDVEPVAAVVVPSGHSVHVGVRLVDVPPADHDPMAQGEQVASP